MRRKVLLLVGYRPDETHFEHLWQLLSQVYGGELPRCHLAVAQGRIDDYLWQKWVYAGVLMFTADPTECLRYSKGGSMIHDNQRICRFRDASGRVHLGFFEDDGVIIAKGDLFSVLEPSGDVIPHSDVFLLPPLYPQKIVGIGSNYLGHIKEMGRTQPSAPKMFLKPTSAVIGPNIAIEIPPRTERVDHEAELGVVIGRRCARVSTEDAMNYVLGSTVVNDVTASRFFKNRMASLREQKALIHFVPSVQPSCAAFHSNLAVRCWVNEECRQDGNTDDLCFDIPTLVSLSPLL